MNDILSGKLINFIDENLKWSEFYVNEYKI